MRRQTPELLLGESREAFLRRAIDDAGLTLKDFATKAGLPVTSLGTILKRGVGTTSIDTAIKLCDALEISLDTLARGKYHSGTSDEDIAIIDVAERLRKARIALGFREAAIAEMLDISIEQYRRFESAHYAVPARYLRLISSIMDIPYEYLAKGKPCDEKFLNIRNLECPEDFEEYNLGLALVDLSAKCGLELDEVANHIGTSKKCIHQWENRIRVPKTEDLSKLCELFSARGVDVNLFTFRNYPAIPESMRLSDKERQLVSKYRDAEYKERLIVEMALDIE